MDNLLIKLKAIADETRLNILRLLLTKNFCVSPLANRLGISESAVSQQLKILREADLVMGVKEGYFVHYMVKKENLLSIGEDINSMIANSDGKEERRMY